MLGLVGGAPLPPRPCLAPAQGSGETPRARGSKLVVAAPPVFAESPRELTAPSEVVRRRADGSLFLVRGRLLLAFLVIPKDARAARAGGQQRPFALEPLRHASRRGPLARGLPARAAPTTECSEHPSGRRRHWCGGAGAPGVVREHARGNRRRRGRCSAAGSTGGSVVGSEVDFGSRPRTCRAAPAQRAPGLRTRRVGR